MRRALLGLFVALTLLTSCASPTRQTEPTNALNSDAGMAAMLPPDPAHDLEDLGGPVLPHMHLRVIYWGTDFIPEYLDAIQFALDWYTGPDSFAYRDVLTQYMRGAGTPDVDIAGTCNNTHTPNAMPIKGNSLNTAIKQCWSNSEIGSGDYTYLVISVGSSNAAWCGWHGWTTINSAVPDPVTFPVIFKPYNTNCGVNAVTSATRVLTHEFAETETDTYPFDNGNPGTSPFGRAWVSHTGQVGLTDEGADECGAGVTASGVYINTVWDNTQHFCAFV